METDRTRSSASDDAAQVLETLRSDRAAVAGRLDGASWFPAGMGAVAALVVASPTVPQGAARSSVLLMALVLGLLAVDRFRRRTGVRLAGLGPAAAALGVLGLVLSLLLLSVAFGLVAAGLAPWVAACCLAAFAIVAWTTRWALSAVKERLARGL